MLSIRRSAAVHGVFVKTNEYFGANTQKRPMRRHFIWLHSVLFIFGIGILFPLPGTAQVAGCIDPAATNYNASATVNNGSCIYALTSYTPLKKVDPLSPALKETSGLQMAGNFLWTFNDSGNDPVLFRIDTLTNAVLQAVTLGGATNVDWEDIGFDGTYLYIGDFGNNANGARTDLKIYRLKLGDIPAYTVDPAPTIPSGLIDVINFTYKDQDPVTATAPNATKFDCEAMLVDGGKIHLFTKNWVNNNTTHYRIDGVAPGSYEAIPLETLATNYLVTAADKAPGKDVVVLLGYQNSGTGNHYMQLLSDFSGGLYFNGNKRLISLPDATIMGQAEGITFRNGTYGYISNEAFSRTVLGFTISVDQKLRSFNTTSFLPLYVLPLELRSFTAVKQKDENLVSWRFETPVKDVSLQASVNQKDFTTLQAFGTLESGSFLHRPSASVTCYRLAWKTTDGKERYSDVVCIKNEVKTSLSRMVLSHSGELSFLFGGSRSHHYTFRLVTMDGKLVANSATQVVAPGVNKVRFLNLPSFTALFLLQAVGDEESSSVLLKMN